MTARIPTLLLMAIIPLSGYGQLQPPELYQYNYSSISPAFVGADGMKITTIGNVTKYKNRVDAYSVFAGFEGIVGKIGFGVNATTSNYDHSTWQLNLPVNYQVPLGENRKLVFGARASIQHTSFDYSWASNTFMPNDPMFYPSGSVKQTGWTTSIGALYKDRRFFAGVSADNVVHSNQEFNYLPSRLQYHIVVGRDFAAQQNFEYGFSVYGMIVNSLSRVDVNNQVLIRKKAIVGLTMSYADDSYLSVNAGYRFGNVVQLIIGFYPMDIGEKYKKFAGQAFLQFKLNRTTTN